MYFLYQIQLVLTGDECDLPQPSDDGAVKLLHSEIIGNKTCIGMDDFDSGFNCSQENWKIKWKDTVLHSNNLRSTFNLIGGPERMKTKIAILFSHSAHKQNVTASVNMILI